MALPGGLAAAADELRHAGPQVVWISSALSGEGRTTIAILLASVLGATGASTVLVQGDVRASSLARQLGVATDHGWSPDRVRSRDVPELTDWAIASVADRFTIVPVANDADVQRAAFESLCYLASELATHYHTVFIDAPPGFEHRRWTIPRVRASEVLVHDGRRGAGEFVEPRSSILPVGESLKIVHNFVTDIAPFE
jgi:MinD-like ATPase involved in chromosome partitioning or flagellar assembly